MISATESLIEAACSGDEQALSELVVICQPDIKRFARRTCATSEDANEQLPIAKRYPTNLAIIKPSAQRR